jgi:hypothetical protein
MKRVDVVKFLSLSFVLLFVGCDSENEPGSSKSISGNIETIAGTGPSNFGYEGDNAAAISAKLGWVTGVAVDNSGNVYLSDGAANVVRKIDDNGIISTIAGNFTGFNHINSTPYAGDGGPAIHAHLNVPYATSVDMDGDVIIADAANHAVREIVTATGIISTLAGKGPGWVGYSGDGSPAKEALMWNPQSIATDAAGNLYIADSQNNAVRMISRSNGLISTIAGLGPEKPGYSGDNGSATAATLDSPQGLAVDRDGNIYISDNGNHVIRKISGGIISTIAGTGATGYSGDGGPALNATFSTLKGLATDSQNNLYIADASNNAIRMIDVSTGYIYTVAGDGVVGYSGDGGAANKARLSNPLSIAIDNQNNLYIADTNNSAIRKVTW